MTPFVLLFLIVSLSVMALAWLKGGHPERLGAVIWMAGWMLAVPLNHFRLDDVRVAVAVIDVVSFAAFFWLALRYSRWWPLGVCACLILIIALHFSAFLIPGMTPRGEVSAQSGLGFLAILIQGGGVFERWLAGETAVSAKAVWARHRPAP